MPYFNATVYVYVSKEDADWDCSCDETFHLGRLLDNPEEGMHLVDYDRITQEEFEKNKHKTFDEYGGI